MSGLDLMDGLFIFWAFFIQVVFIIHFAVRKWLFATYTLRYGWLVYAFCLPASVISVVLLIGGKPWAIWLGGFIFLFFSAFGYWVDYVRQIQWRKPLVPRIMIPYVFLYLATIMFYWWPLGIFSRSLWLVFAGLFLISTILNITSH